MSKNLHCDVMCLSEARPPEHLEINMTTSVGLIAIKNLAVLWLL